MAFSASMMLADLDYIAPSQACILPQLKSNKGGAPKGAATGGLGGGAAIQIGDDSAGAEEVVKITLADCLACSGCVTTAETLLVTQQSKDEIVNLLKAADGIRVVDETLKGGEKREEKMDPVPLPCIVVSVSEQSLSSIANQLKISIEQAASKISGFCRTVMKAKLVIDTRWAQVAALRATEQEFIHRLEKEPERLPMIVSSCPGWVCYCEKTHPNLLPKLSNVRSAQAIIGTYLKAVTPQWLAQQEEGDAQPSSSSCPPSAEPPYIYHVSVQPCFDKKLEAARSDFAVDVENGIKETDCVLSTQELLEWMQEVDPSIPWSGSWNSTPVTTERQPRGVTNSGQPQQEDSPVGESFKMQGSGGYHSWVLQSLVDGGDGEKKFLGLEEIEYAQQRNHNHKVIDVVPILQAKNPGSKLLPSGPRGGGFKICIAYGFQHIQNIVRGINRKMQSAKDYKLIELMACPDGCLNGGGQVRTKNNAATLAGVNSTFEEYNTRLIGESGLRSPSEEAPHSKRLRTENGAIDGEGSSEQCQLLEMRPATISEGEEQLFTPEAVAAWAGSALKPGDEVTKSLLFTEFHDRKAEMNDAPDAQLVHALKW